MGRRRKLRGTQTAARVSDPELMVHDRRTHESFRQAALVPEDVEDPYDRGSKITVMRNTRDDLLAWLKSRAIIDTAQMDAGRRYQADFERAERGPRAIDPTKEAVDGGRMPDPITESQRKAAMRLNHMNRALGIDGSSIMMDFLIHRQTFSEIAGKRGLAGDRWRDYFSRRVWECLNALAIEYGCAQYGSKPQDVEIAS
jgi:hypothetical protein